MPNKYHCKIYCSPTSEMQDFDNYIYSVIKKPLLNNIDVYISNNDEYNKTNEQEFPDGFLYYQYLIDIEPIDQNIIDDKNILNRDNYIGEINELLKNLWSKNIPAIASCHFENELLEQGGYKSLKIPFPGLSGGDNNLTPENTNPPSQRPS